MAEEAKKKADAPDKAPPAAEKAGEKKEHGKGGAGGLLAKMPVLIGGVMIIEAAVLFAGFKFLGGGTPQVAAGADLVTDDSGSAPTGGSASGSDSAGGASGAHSTAAATPAIDKKAMMEVPVLDSRFPNKQTGHTFLYDVTIFAVIKTSNKERVETTITQRKALITDRVRTIIAQSDPEKLGGGSEPGLETLRRQVKYQLDIIVGDTLIEEVLVPRCIPFRTDF